MAQQIQFTCDVCAVGKKQTNHWWKVGIGDGILSIAAWDNALDPFDVEDSVQHLCGRACVLRKVEEFMAIGNAQSTEPKPAPTALDSESASIR